MERSYASDSDGKYSLVKKPNERPSDKAKQIEQKTKNAAKRYYKDELSKLKTQTTQIQTTQELGAFYTHFRDTVPTPWRTAKKRPTARFKQFWNHTLDNMARQRARLYRKGKQQMSKKVGWSMPTWKKREARAEKRKWKEKMTQHLTKATGQEASKLMSKLL